MRQPLQPKLFQGAPHRARLPLAVLHDPLRASVLMRLSRSSEFTSTPCARNSSQAVSKARARQIVQRAWAEGKLTFNLVRHLMYPLFVRREHKTLGHRSPVTNVPMISQAYS